jgi:hypothetical protein
MFDWMEELEAEIAEVSVSFGIACLVILGFAIGLFGSILVGA